MFNVRRTIMRILGLENEDDKSRNSRYIQKIESSKRELAITQTDIIRAQAVRTQLHSIRRGGDAPYHPPMGQ